MKASEYAQWLTDNKDKMEEIELIKELGWKFIKETLDTARTFKYDFQFIGFLREQDRKWNMLCKMVPEFFLVKYGYRALYKMAFPESYPYVVWVEV